MGSNSQQKSLTANIDPLYPRPSSQELLSACCHLMLAFHPVLRVKSPEISCVVLSWSICFYFGKSWYCKRFQIANVKKCHNLDTYSDMMKSTSGQKFPIAVSILFMKTFVRVEKRLRRLLKITKTILRRITFLHLGYIYYITLAVL